MGNERIKQKYSSSLLFSEKIPASERSTIPPAAQTGTSIGIIFTTPLASIMIGDGFLGGWPSAFYVFGKIKYEIELSMSL